MGIIYIGSLLLFAIGCGIMVTGVIFLLTRQERKKATLSVIIGILLVISTMIIPKLLPSVEDERIVQVDKKSLIEIEIGYRCSIIDKYAQMTFIYEGNKRIEVEEVCNQYSLGNEYKIAYRYEKGKFMIRNED
ncbi:hypothetical protein [Litchfieldia salsa]|nr:hypothetical protein [Litchfieldia salsa]